MDFEGRARIHSHLDIAPLIDIVFLLLVFFMLTSTFMVPEAIDLELPESRSANPADNMHIVVSINQLGDLALNNERVELEQLREKLESILKQKPQASITLKSDARTEVQRLIVVMDEIRAAGGSNVSLATTQK